MYFVKRKWTNAKKTNGYDSKFEAGGARDYELLKKAGKIRDFRKQVPIDLVVNGYKICTYIIDFVVYHNDGVVEYVEYKGFRTREWINKWKLFEALYTDKPNVKLTVVTQNTNYRIPHAKKIKI